MNTGLTDTIVRRLDTATDAAPPGSGQIDVEMVGLSLVSDNMLNFFGTVKYIGTRILKDLATDTYIYGNDNGSTMEIHFDNALGGLGARPLI